MAIIVKRHVAKMHNALIIDAESGVLVVNNKAGRKVPRAEQLRAMNAWIARHNPAPASDDLPF